MPYEFIDTIDSSDNPGFLSSEAFSLDGVYPENELKNLELIISRFKFLAVKL